MTMVYKANSTKSDPHIIKVYRQYVESNNCGHCHLTSIHLLPKFNGYGIEFNCYGVSYCFTSSQRTYNTG